MAVFPKIQSPCPYKANLAAVMDGDFCRMCKRNVVDLSPMSDGERLAFLAGCEGEVCVSYRLPAAIAAAALAAAAMGAPLAAAAAEADNSALVEIVVGGLRNPAKAELIRDVADLKAPELPVIYEDAPPPAPAKTEPAQAKPVRTPAAS